MRWFNYRKSKKTKICLFSIFGHKQMWLWLNPGGNFSQAWPGVPSVRGDLAPQQQQQQLGRRDEWVAGAARQGEPAREGLQSAVAGGDSHPAAIFTHCPRETRSTDFYELSSFKHWKLFPSHKIFWPTDTRLDEASRKPVSVSDVGGFCRSTEDGADPG